MNRGMNLVYNGVLVLNGFINGRGTCSPVRFVLYGLMNKGINLVYNGVLLLNELINGRGTYNPVRFCPGWVNE